MREITKMFVEEAGMGLGRRVMVRALGLGRRGWGQGIAGREGLGERGVRGRRLGSRGRETGRVPGREWARERERGLVPG